MSKYVTIEHREFFLSTYRKFLALNQEIFICHLRFFKSGLFHSNRAVRIKYDFFKLTVYRL
jgi:hypothetical protein